MSATNEALERRRRLYQERIVRRLIIQRPGWTDGWTPDELKAVNDVQDGSVCRVLRYQAPVVPPDDEVMRHPVAPATDDHTLMQGLARLQIAQREPARQFELFGWRTPPPEDLYAQAAFEKAKNGYWSRILAESLEQLHVLKDTSDFGANYLLRLVYLYGSTPPPLRSVRATWRGAAGFERDPNFSSTVDALITERFLAYKFWLDEPFNVADSARPEDVRRIQAERQKLVEAIPPRYDGGELRAEMTYWSENHYVLFATAEYLAGQMWPDEVFRSGRPFRAEGPSAVRPGDMTGRQHVDKARERLLRWLNDRLRFGFSEWNAPGYYEEDFGALFNLVDFALDAQVRVRASMAIDLMLFDMARLSHAGSFGVTAGRSHFKHKNCGYQQSTGDLAEVIFATRGAVVGDASDSTGSFVTSAYEVPEVLIRIAHDNPPEITDRRRISLDPSEASLYGIGTSSEDDVLFWWTRGAYFIKEVVNGSDRVVGQRHLSASNPFRDILPKLRALSIILKGEGVASAADAFSVLTEGSALTQARLIVYRTPNGMLSSVRQFHPQQLNFQTQFCQATLGMGATVWTTQPTAPSENLRDVATAAGAVGGVAAGAAAGAEVGSFFGPIGTAVGGLAGGIAGGIGGGVGAHAATSDDDKAIEVFPSSDDGPDSWTGTVTVPFVAQVDGAAIIAYSPRDIQWWLFESKTHAWFPQPAFDPGSVIQRSASDSTEDDGLWTFGRVGDGYVGLYSARKPVWTTDGPWKDRELVADGDGNVFILQIGNKEQFGSYANFVDRVSGARIHISDLGEDEVECSYDVPGGRRLELHNEGHQVRYGGPGISKRFPRFETPYIDGGRVGNRAYRYTIAYGDRLLHHDFSEIKTKGAQARVVREVDGRLRDRRNLTFQLIARRGAMRVFAENSIEACRHALGVEGANALTIDACLTRDGHAIAWHDWDPDSFSAVWRRLGLIDVGRYKPRAPPSESPWRRPTIGLSIGELRAHYGYEPVDGEDAAAPPAPVIPTVREITTAAADWPSLLHLIVDVQLPGELAPQLGQAMARAVFDALPAAPAFQTTLRSTDQDVVKAMQAALPEGDGRIGACWNSVLETGPPEQAAFRLPEAVRGAIALGTRVASFERPQSIPAPDLTSVVSPMIVDLTNWDAFNFNPSANLGRQIDWVIAGTINDATEQRWLVDEEISGIVTDEIPQLLEIVRR